MSPITYIVFGIILVITTIYIIVYVIYPGSGSNDLLTRMTSLGEKTDLMYSDQVKTSILGTSGSSVMGFFKLLGGDKTMRLQDSYTPLLYIENNWALEISPAPQHKSESAARLSVVTNDGGNMKKEYIELPQIPQQKWVFIAILRDGRRFDVLYNNQIVASQRLENYPVVINSPLSVGNKGLSGSVIHIIVNSSSLTPLQVERERLKYVDTNGTVLEDNSIDMSFPSIKLFAECPSGLPCNPITSPPSNNLLQWNTPYA